MRKTTLVSLVALVALGAVLGAAAACRDDAGASGAARPAGPAAPPSDAAPSPPPPATDRPLDDVFAFLAGLPSGSSSLAAFEEEPGWKSFAADAETHWRAFDAAVLGPMRAWNDKDFGLARERTASLLYPFGGPDLATASALFPGAATVVLMGLEPVGNLPEFERLTPEGRAEALADLGTLAFEFLTHGYFATMDMMDIYSKRKIDGALPVIAFFVKRAGDSVAGVRRLSLDEKGAWTETPYERLKERPRRPYGVRIDCFKPGETALRTVYYFSCNIENQSFAAGSPLHRFFGGFEGVTTFVKAGSYLLHWNNFSTLRDLVLERSLYVLEDDTAIPYRFFKRDGWAVTLFGRYATPVKDFTNVEQPDLRAAYEDPDGDVRPLPFHFGYRWRTQVDNLMLAERPRRPSKAPVEGK
ncbi:MAG TPA: hypothetical protein PLP83_06105 [Candidatus Aminicenantes bacterium]|nr:hypothetical protein [Candidatus Aminicenantes bacterium]